MEPRMDGWHVLYKRAIVVMLSLFPFGISAVTAYGAWGLSGGLGSAPRLAVVVLSWVIVFAAGTQAFWKVVGRLAPRSPT